MRKYQEARLAAAAAHRHTRGQLVHFQAASRTANRNETSQLMARIACVPNLWRYFAHCLYHVMVLLRVRVHKGEIIVSIDFNEDRLHSTVFVSTNHHFHRRGIPRPLSARCAVPGGALGPGFCCRAVVLE